MSDHASWSLQLGRWGGIYVRLHMFFLLFAAFTLYGSWRAGAALASPGLDWIAVESLCVLLASVLLHDVGHAWVAVRRGGYVEELVLGPLGGLATIRGLSEPRSELWVQGAGPLTNLAICGLCVPVLTAAGGWHWGLLSPLAPVGLIEGGSAIIGLKLVFWINWILVLVNLLPAFPFDGGRALRAALLVRWPQLKPRAALLIVASMAKATALTICAAALVFQFDDVNSLLPTRFALILLAIFLFFSAKHEENRNEAETLDEGAALSHALSRASRQSETGAAQEIAEVPGTVSRWLEQRRAFKLQRQREREAEEERQVDEILVRVHARGMKSLSSADRALLERVSARYRHRSRQ
ncbi:MAG: hypothetical protein NTY19_45015 [Planctomycetota bacterium]|nr:hypothetical protein [Planctomycetota bacterium]